MHPNPTPKGAPFYIASGELSGSTQQRNTQVEPTLH